MMAFYHATFYPDNIGNGEYDGKGTYALRDLTIGETWSNNKYDLARRMKEAGSRCIFGRYPVILDIENALQEAVITSNHSVLRYRLKSDLSRWERIL